MSTPIVDRDLTKQAPHSPRERVGGFVIAKRTIDKCRASLTGKLGEYHYDCPLDNVLFGFKGINGDQFKAAVKTSKTYEEIGAWLQANGTKKTPAEINAWSDGVDVDSPMKSPKKRAHFIENCTQLGLNPETSTTFDWLEADDRVSFPKLEGQILKPGESTSSSSETILNPASGELLALVAQQPFFKGMDERLLELLSDSILEIRFRPGDWIYRQGESANRFYLILEGKVLIESEVKDRGVLPIRTLGPGDDLGWAWLFPPYHMHFSACAVDSTRTIFFYGTRLREKCETNHELGYQLMKRVAEVVVRNLNATQQRLLEHTDGSTL
jgi:hypothetical protein